MESQRQKKVATILQEEISAIILNQIQPKGILLTVSEVQVTADLSIAKIYISIFPAANRAAIFKEIQGMNSFFRKNIGNKLAQVMRIIPELQFKLDTTLDQVERIEQELKGEGDNPVL